MASNPLGGDYAAVGRGVALVRLRLVQQATEEIRRGRVEQRMIAELLVDAVLNRAFRGGWGETAWGAKWGSGEVGQVVGESCFFSKSPRTMWLMVDAKRNSILDMGVSINGGTPKWMVYKGNPTEMDDLGIPPFMETPIFIIL